jgi:N-acetylglutamate synthase-like GNAT family acetyltransferase
MNIRKATTKDERMISDLLTQLGYAGTELFLAKKMKLISENPNSELFVYEKEQKVIGVISIDFILQLALKGDFARISYLSVDTVERSKGIGKELEELCVRLAKERNCERIEVHCTERRVDAHRFYIRQGYYESPKYFVKKTGSIEK